MARLPVQEVIVANRKQRRAAERKREEADAAETPEFGAENAPGGGAVPFPDHEKDALFKAQMHAQNFILGYWKYGLSIIGIGLLSTLGWGLYVGRVDDSQKDVQARIHQIDRKMPTLNPLAEAGISDLEDTPEILAEVEAGAAHYEAVATASKGVGAVTAWMRAAAAWERVGKSGKVLAAYEAAHAMGAPGVIGWSAASSYASALADGGDVEGAAAALRSLADGASGIEAEQALLTLARLYQDAERVTESRKIYGEFTERYPKSKLSDEVALGLNRLGVGG
jgi:tetratricopeptide (TPR) repeat protein